MERPKARNLEERLKRPVAILDDNPHDRRLFEINLKKLAKRDGLELEVLSSQNPDEIFEAATRDTRITAVLVDVFLPKTPTSMKSRFENGLDVARAIKEVRGDSIDVVLMSGIGRMTEENQQLITRLLGRRYIDSFSKASYVDASWEKSGLPDDMEKLYDIVKKGVLKHGDHEYNRLHVLTGESGTGKSSVAWNLGKRVPNLKVFVSDTTKKPRQSELLGPEVPILYQRITHNYHPTHESLHDTIMEMSSPLIWTSKRKVLAKETYEWLYNSLRKDSALREIDIYALDLEAIDKCLKEERKDALVLTPFLDVVKRLRELYGERCLVTCFEADEFSRTEWMRKEERNHSEILERMNQERMLKPKYHEIGDMIIDTSYRSTLSEDPEYDRRRSIDQIAHRESKIIEISREKPHGTTAKEMCTDYVSEIEGKLAARTKGNVQKRKLEEGQTIEFPPETMVSFNRERSSDNTGLIGLMAWLSQAEVTDVERGKDGTYVHLVAMEVAKVLENVRNEEPWKNAMKDVFSFYLSKEGYKTTATSIFRRKSYKGPETVSLLYALDDYNYFIQLIFD